MDEKTKRIIEIEGIKVEVDLRTAKKVEAFKVGDRVKLLIKDYSGYKAHAGCIIGFDAFKNLPTIIIAYIENLLSFSAEDGKVSLAYLNAETKDVEICPMCEDDVLPTRDTILSYFNRAIDMQTKKMEDIKTRKEWFLRQYGTSFGVGAAEIAEATADNQ